MRHDEVPPLFGGILPTPTFCVGVPATETKRLTERSGVLFYIATGELSFKLRRGANAPRRSAAALWRHPAHPDVLCRGPRY